MLLATDSRYAIFTGQIQFSYTLIGVENECRTARWHNWIVARGVLALLVADFDATGRERLSSCRQGDKWRSHG